MSYPKVRGVFCLTIFCSVAVLAQDEADRSLADPAPAAPAPMTVSQKFRYRLRHSFDGVEAARAAGGAAFDEARGHPKGWGRGWDSFGVRVTSHFGQHLIKEQIMFGVEALDHETPGHLRSRRTGARNRIIDAVKYTFICSSDSGKLMPAYSRLVGAYGSAYISRQWYPPEYHTAAAGFYAGSTSLGVDIGLNVLREFLPDIKKKVFRRP